MLCNSVVTLPDSSVGKESAWNAGDPGLIPGLGRSSAEGIGYPPQYPDLENSIDCIVHGVTKSQTQLSECRSLFTFTFYSDTSFSTHRLMKGNHMLVPVNEGKMFD